MSDSLVGQVHAQGKVLSVNAHPVDPATCEAGRRLTVTVTLDGAQMELDVPALRRARQVLAQAEQQLLLREAHLQATCNLKLDL